MRVIALLSTLLLVAACAPVDTSDEPDCERILQETGDIGTAECYPTYRKGAFDH